MRYQLFIFDLDGTLVDTSPGIIRSVQQVEKTLGLEPLPMDTLKKFIGPTLEESFTLYYHATPEEVPKMLQAYRSRYGTIGVGEASVYPGIPEILDAIDQAGAVSAVATLKHYTMAEKTLEKFDLTHRFAAIAAGKDGVTTKAGLIREVLEQLDWKDHATAVMLGDSRYDGIGAMEAGVDFVPLTYGFGFAEPGSLEGLATVFTADTPMALVEFVKEALQ